MSNLDVKHYLDVYLLRKRMQDEGVTKPPFFVVFHTDRCCPDVRDSGQTTTTCEADKIKLNS
jgi:hypothetical protein